MFRNMVNHGAELIAIPSAFTAKTGKAHWEILVRARAIENLCYVVAAGQGGYHLNGRESYGDSMIVDPWGQILDRLASGSGVVIADYDRQQIAKVRRSFPVLAKRTTIDFASLGGDAGYIGAAGIARATLRRAGPDA